jgi:hypothetical protein
VLSGYCSDRDDKRVNEDCVAHGGAALQREARSRRQRNH